MALIGDSSKKYRSRLRSPEMQKETSDEIQVIAWLLVLATVFGLILQSETFAELTQGGSTHDVVPLCTEDLGKEEVPCHVLKG